jgi:hypothetical protein
MESWVAEEEGMNGEEGFGRVETARELEGGEATVEVDTGTAKDEEWEAELRFTEGDEPRT